MLDVIRHITDDNFSSRKATHWYTFNSAQHSPTAAALSTFFLMNHTPNSPELNALITRFRKSYCSESMSCESKRLKKSRSDWLNSGNALIQHLSEKMRFSCFPVFLGTAEVHTIWGGTIKRHLIPYFIHKISAKKYQNVFTCVKVIANQRWYVFWDTVYTYSLKFNLLFEH